MKESAGRNGKTVLICFKTGAFCFRRVEPDFYVVRRARFQCADRVYVRFETIVFSSRGDIIFDHFMRGHAGNRGAEFSAVGKISVLFSDVRNVFIILEIARELYGGRENVPHVGNVFVQGKGFGENGVFYDLVVILFQLFLHDFSYGVKVRKLRFEIKFPKLSDPFVRFRVVIRPVQIAFREFVP